MTPSLQTAIALHRAGRVHEALPHYTQALAESPEEPAALYYGGVAAWSTDDFDTALDRLDRLIALVPTASAEAHYHRGLVHRSRHSLDLALQDYERATAINPNYAPALNNLGELLRSQGAFASAEAHFVRALKANPQLHEARLNRGLNAQQSGDLALAKNELGECVKRDPDNAQARSALVNVLLDLSLQSEALALARASVKRLPKAGELWNALGQAEQAAGNVAAALTAYEAGLGRAPSLVPLALNAAFLEHENANTPRAQEIYSKIEKIPNAEGARFRLATLLPTIASSEHEIDVMRSDFLSRLKALRDSEVMLRDPLNDFGDTPFYLSYHGRSDDRVLLATLAEGLRTAAPSLVFRAPHVDRRRRDGPWRVGFCSHFLFDQSVGRSMHAFVRALPRDRFDVHILRVPPFFDDAIARAIDADSRVHRLPLDLNSARTQIAALELDVLIFPEIGMDALTYYLAHARLARVQWTTLGHPCTSGLDTIDSYLSYAALEPEGSERFYSETLVRLPEGAIYPDYPAVAMPPAPRNRNALGLPAQGPLFVCPQSLFKLMPQFDSAIARILDELPAATLLLPESRMPGQTDALRRRFEISLGRCATRVRYFPRRTRSEFVELVGACDVLLDPFPVGGGITTWDALASGTPIVTMPSDLMRSRFAYSALTAAGIAETIARNEDEYVSIAASLAQNADKRDALRQTLREHAPEIYRDVRAVSHFMGALTESLVSSHP
jgi:protein O-GlcNAc transferase